MGMSRKGVDEYVQWGGKYLQRERDGLTMSRGMEGGVSMPKGMSTLGLVIYPKLY